MRESYNSGFTLILIYVYELDNIVDSIYGLKETG